MERPPKSLWNRILAQPERAPELIALAASDRFGPQAEQWVRVAGAGHTPEELARVAYKKHVRLARVDECLVHHPQAFDTVRLAAHAQLVELFVKHQAGEVDLRRLARWAVSQGAGMALLNPIHANIPGGEQPSPYYPSSRCFRNPIDLRPPGSAPADAKALNTERVIDPHQSRTRNPPLSPRRSVANQFQSL